jgi:hypothetical protein
MDPKNTSNSSTNPSSPGTSRPGETPSRETRPESRPLTDNERHAGTEQDDKVRRSNLAGDQDVESEGPDDTER